MTPALFISLLVALIVGAYILDSSPWRYCPRCRCYWHRAKLKRTAKMPVECDGVIKAQVCRWCE